MLRSATVIALATLLLACSDDGAISPGAGGGGVGGDGGAPTGCLPGEITLTDGCRPAGIPPEACAAGFESDDAGGCVAILPPRCPPGQLAVPGDMTCREVAPCGTSPWGDAPIDGSTQFVDQSYPNGDSDGSETKPWPTIQQGVVAAASGGLVAITDGSYAESVSITNPVRLWGRCPSTVSIRGSLTIAASGSEVHALALTQLAGVTVNGATGVLLQQLWIHDLSDIGVALAPATEATLVNSLIENAAEFGVLATGQATVTRSLVRDTAAASNGLFGAGIAAYHNPPSTRGKLVIDSSVVEGNREAGVMAGGADVEISASVIRDTLARGDGQLGAGVVVRFYDAATRETSTASIETSVLERNTWGGIYVTGSDATLVHTVMRDTLPAPDLGGGRGAIIEYDPTADLAGSLTVRESLVEGNSDVGVSSAGAELIVEGTIIRDTAPQPATQRHGWGIAAIDHTANDTRATLTVRESVVLRSFATGIGITASDGSVERTLVSDVRPELASNVYGRGINVQSRVASGSPGDLVIRDTVVEISHEHGINVAGSNAILESVEVTQTLASPDAGLFGDGLAVFAYTGVANVTATNLQISRSQRAGIANFGAFIQLTSSVLECNALDLTSQEWAGRTPVFADEGGNICGCEGAPGTCRVSPAQLEPPTELEDVQ